MKQNHKVYTSTCSNKRHSYFKKESLNYRNKIIKLFFATAAQWVTQVSETYTLLSSEGDK